MIAAKCRLHYNITRSGPDELTKCVSSNLRLYKFGKNTRSSSTFFNDLLLNNDATMWRQIQLAFHQTVLGNLLFSCIVLVSLERSTARPITVLVSSCNADETLFHYFELNDIKIHQGEALGHTVYSRHFIIHLDRARLSKNK